MNKKEFAKLNIGQSVLVTPSFVHIESDRVVFIGNEKRFEKAPYAHLSDFCLKYYHTDELEALIHSEKVMTETLDQIRKRIDSVKKLRKIKEK